MKIPHVATFVYKLSILRSRARCREVLQKRRPTERLNFKRLRVAPAAAAEAGRGATKFPRFILSRTD